MQITNLLDITKDSIICFLDNLPVENNLLKSAAFFFLTVSIFGLLFTCVKMPSILGYMVAGIILGPVLQYIVDENIIEQIKEAGDFGLILLMFVTGIEFDINKFIKNGPMKPVSFVGYQILYTIIFIVYVLLLPKLWIIKLISNPISSSILFILLAISIYLYGSKLYSIINLTHINKLQWKLLLIIFVILLFNIKNSLFIDLEMKDLQIIILLITLLTFNSTAISIKLLENRDQKETHVGTNVIGVLIAQDLVFMVALIILKSFGGSIDFISIGLKIGLAIFILFLVNLLSKAKPSFFSYSLDYVRKSSPELLTVIVISFCLLCASISDACGMSDIYGAFIAGLLLGNVYKHRHQTLLMCQPISSLLIAIFFVYIGIWINLEFLIKQFPLIILINIIILIVKYFINYRTNVILNKNDDKFSEQCIKLSALMLTQVSEFSTMMIAIVSANIVHCLALNPNITYFGLNNESIQSFFMILESSSLVSLTLGCLITVLLKRMLYQPDEKLEDE